MIMLGFIKSKKGMECVAPNQNSPFGAYPYSNLSKRNHIVNENNCIFI